MESNDYKCKYEQFYDRKTDGGPILAGNGFQCKSVLFAKKKQIFAFV